MQKMSIILKSIKSVKSSIINDSFSLVYDKKVYELTNEYFQIIQELIQRYNIEKIKPIDSNQDMENISFPQNITYKLLILKYIAFEYEKGNFWLKELYEKIIDQNFPSEEYFLQLFNISEFEIRTKPSCFQSLQNKKNFIPQSKIFTYNIIETPLPNDPLIQNIYYKQNIYKYVQIIRDQIENPINPINFIMKNYRICMTKYIINKRDELVDIKLNKSNEIFEENCNKICNNIFEQINNFINNLTSCLILLYSKINNYQIFFEEIDEFISLLVALLFEPNEKRNKYDINNIEERDDFYKVILDLFKLKNIKITEKIKKNIKAFRGIEPEDFGVPEKYCLNEKSVNYYMKCFKKNFGGNIPEIPYEKSIKMLKDIYKYKSPIDKLLLTTKLRKEIKNEIDEFWGDLPENELKSKELKFEIEIDDYINVFEYMISKAGMNDLYVHVDFVEIFTNDKIRRDINDYNLQQIKVGLLQLNDLEDKKENINNIKNE